MNESLEYNLPKNAYVNFDAVSLKDFIIQRLNENPQFTDQNYEGSNLSSLIDIIAYSYHVLLFYLNQNSSESLFSQTSLYENMNKIVNLIGYKPTGKQTSLVSVDCVAGSGLPIGGYTLQKFSYFLVDKIQYTILEDFDFGKTTNQSETIESIGDKLIVYQGTVGEYPIYVAEGVEYETFPIVVDNTTNSKANRFVAHNTLSVYVKEVDNGLWREYYSVDSLYLSESGSRVYDVRLNENGHYEVKFGNGTFGKLLKEGDEVAVYYLLSDNISGIISKNAINGNKLFNFNSNRFNNIYSDVSDQNEAVFITASNSASLTFSNSLNSTTISESESVEDIRQNAPFLVGSFFRLVTNDDYEKYLNKIFSNITHSIKVVDNDDYFEYLNYFYEICVDPNKNNNVILNQVNFADSCDFNNVNIFVVPRFSIMENESYPPFVSTSFKNLILDETKNKKMIGHEIIPRDPIYVAFDLGFSNSPPNKMVYANTELVIIKDTQSRINDATLKKRVSEKIIAFFNPSKNSLGGTLNMSNLTAEILGISGIKRVYMRNGEETFNGLSFISWNPMYDGVDEEYVNQTVTLPYFKFPYLYRPNSLESKMVITNS